MSRLTDRNGEQVHEFSVQAANLGLSRLADLLLAMCESKAWLQFSDGTGSYTFLPGEFDYFLTQHGVSREHVMYGVRDIAAKATLEGAMDERRTGDPVYRRSIDVVREEVPERPGRPIEPFGYTQKEHHKLGEDAPPSARREPLGGAVRSWTAAGGKPPPRPQTTRTEQVKRALKKMSDADLQDVLAAAGEELRRRHAG